jgi:hypothetical protein
MKTLRLVASFAALTWMAMEVIGQSTSGEILGGVRDPSGAVVPEAHVIIRSLETNNTVEGENGTDGRFRFPLLVRMKSQSIGPGLPGMCKRQSFYA